MCRKAFVRPDITLAAALCSLVKKDAGMLDAFGKGASEDIQLAKSELYSQMTWDKDTKSSLGAELQMTTPLPSPPPSPKPRKASAEEIGTHSCNFLCTVSTEPVQDIGVCVQGFLCILAVGCDVVSGCVAASACCTSLPLRSSPRH